MNTSSYEYVFRVLVLHKNVLGTQYCFGKEALLMWIHSISCSVRKGPLCHLQSAKAKISLCINNDQGLPFLSIYRIQPNYHTYPYKRTVKQFCSLQNAASVLFVYFFVKAYVVGTCLNCIDFVDAIQMSTHNICFYKENQRQNRIDIIK